MSQSQIYKAPTIYNKTKLAVFLAGVIDMGRAENWQDVVTDYLKDLNIIILNPRRNNWDASLEQSMNNPVLVEQINWELVGQDDSEVILFVFPEHSKAPISFLELGLALGLGKKCFVYAHPNFYRRVNIELTCNKFNIKTYDTILPMLEQVKKYIVEDFWEEATRI